MGSAFVLDDVSFSYPGTGSAVLDIPKLCIECGERVFIQGDSGSGKTTLLSLLSGVASPSKGKVSILGIEDFSGLSSSHRDAVRAQHIGFIFQMFNLIPYLSVLENVLLGVQFSSERASIASSKGSLRTEAKRLLKRLGLSDEELLLRKVTELSVGQQQRVSAARALIGSPEIIIADEPTSALDFNSRKLFLDLLISECNESGSTLIFVSHDSSLASHFDRVISMSDFSGAKNSELA